MLPERVEKLRQEYVDQYVVVDTERAELAQLRNAAGQVRTINFNGLAMVQFGDVDRSWHDIELDYLKVVDKPKPKPKPAKAPQAAAKPADKKPTTEKTEPPTESKNNGKLSRLELARLQKESQQQATHPPARTHLTP